MTAAELPRLSERVEWRFRRATPADVDAIMALETATFTTDAWSAESMRAEVASPHCFYLVAYRDETEELAGYAGLLAAAGSPDADIQTIAVAPFARRLGLGRALMIFLIDEATTRGADAVFLEVRDDNPGARSLYASLGFEEIGVRPRYYQPDDVDAVIMRHELKRSPA